MDRMPSVMSHNFSQVPNVEVPRSKFDRSHGYKTTLEAGYLVPVFVDEALPGDTFNLNMAGFGRLATPIYPIMDNMFMDTFFFAVPIRLIWDNWQKFNGEQVNPGDSTDFLCPVVDTPVGGFQVGTLYDYFGLPTEVDIEAPVNFAGRAYNLIYNEWFRDENLIDSAVVDRDDGPDLDTDYVLQRRGKRHDYFTSCLPWPQKGDAVSLPLGTSAPVTGSTLTTYAYRAESATGTPRGDINIESSLLPNGALYVQNPPLSNEKGRVEVDPATIDPATSSADLSAATAATINDIREAFQIQKLYEKDARGGTRYTEIIKAHFGVTSPDARLQRPEYLGGGSTPININPVEQTSSTDGVSPQGNLAAMGTVAFNRHGFSKSFTEHCIIIGMVSVRADLTYQKGINRMWSRRSRFDFYWPSFAHLGEQAVLSKEIYADGTASDQDVFGYQERYAEYRYKPSSITGQFRSNFAQSLDAWHLSQDFGTRPVLDKTFIEETPPIDRVVAVPSEPDFIFDSYFDYKCVRPMPVYSVPGMVDHF